MFNLEITIIEVHFRILREVVLPAYPGSAIRGAWGHALRRVHPQRRSRRCRQCPIERHCRWSGLDVYLFDSPADHPFLFDRPDYVPYRLNRYPPPFVLAPPAGGRYRCGERLSFSLLLVGRGIACLPFIRCSLEKLSRGILVRVREALRLERIDCRDPLDEGAVHCLYDPGGREEIAAVTVSDWPAVRSRATEALERNGSLGELELEFVTPVRLKDRNRLNARPDFTLFVRTLLRRLTLLSMHSPLTDPFPYQRLIEQAGDIEVDGSGLRWVEWTRYSSRQKCAMQLGGLLGRYRLAGPLDEVFPYLVFGSYCHLGKQASFGLGRYRLI